MPSNIADNNLVLTKDCLSFPPTRLSHRQVWIDLWRVGTLIQLSSALASASASAAGVFYYSIPPPSFPLKLARIRGGRRKS